MVGDPTEGALVVAAAKANMWRDKAEARYPRVAEVPFDSARKRMSTFTRTADGQGYVAFVKGAPDFVLELCTHALRDGEPVAPERLVARAHLGGQPRDGR